MGLRIFSGIPNEKMKKVMPDLIINEPKKGDLSHKEKYGYSDCVKFSEFICQIFTISLSNI